MKKIDTPPLIRKVSLRLSEDDYEDLKAIAHEDFVSMAFILQRLLAEYIKRRRPQ